MLDFEDVSLRLPVRLLRLLFLVSLSRVGRRINQDPRVGGGPSAVVLQGTIVRAVPEALYIRRNDIALGGGAKFDFEIRAGDQLLKRRAAARARTVPMICELHFGRDGIAVHEEQRPGHVVTLYRRFE